MMPMLKQFLINSLAQPADGVGRNFIWTAPERLQLRKLLTWIGTDGALPGTPFPMVDVFTAIYANHIPGTIVSFFALDHYTNFVGPHQWPEIFEPGQIVLETGVAIIVGHCCTPVDPTLKSHSHTMVFGWYEPLPIIEAS